MRKSLMLLAILLTLLLSSFYASSFQCYVSNLGMISIVPSGEASLAWEAPTIVIDKAHSEEETLFTITNNLDYSVHVHVDLTWNDVDILTPGWGPKECELPPAHTTMSWSGVLNGTELSSGFYYLVFHVDAVNSGVSVDFDVTVEVEVVD